MFIQEVIVRHVAMKLKTPFKSGVDTISEKIFLVVEVHNEDGTIGYGEGLAFERPYYTEETVETMNHIVETVLIPTVLYKKIDHPSHVHELFQPVRRNYMAKAAVETAVWDLYAQLQKQPLAQLIGGTQSAVEVGVAIGLQPTEEQLVATIQRALDEGYRRIKVKITSQHDIELLQTIRRHFPDIALMADANSAYTLDDIEQLKALDAFNLLMIEQPLAHDDIVEHAELQRHIQTPICLDESICSLDDMKRAVKLGSCQIVNIKLARVGGFTEAMRIHDYCQQHGIGVWCGGMLEAGIGRSHALALASLPNFRYAADIASADRYWERDIVTPMIASKDAHINVPTNVGRGFQIDEAYLDQITLKKRCIR
ncbi:MAG: o-succinylbenzoate synthase [Caryophanon sp.]|nr:o-succinylbenzoate synthase [Caryophanon sp.]